MTKLQKCLVASFILLTPLLYPIGPTIDVRGFQQTIFQYGAMLLCTFFVRNIWLSIFFAWTLLLFYLNGGQVGSESVLNIFLGIMLYGIARNFYAKFKFQDSVRWIGWVAIVSMIFMVLQLLRIDPIHSFYDPTQGGVISTQAFSDPVGMFMLKAHMGIFMALLIPILCTVHPALGLIGFIPVAFSESTAAILAALGGFLYYLFFLHRRFFYTLTALGLIGLGFYAFMDFNKAPEMYRSRIGMWHLTIRKTFERPIGYGPDSFRNITPSKNFMIMSDDKMTPAIAYVVPGKADSFNFSYYDPNPSIMKELNQNIQVKSANMWDHPHNEYLNLLFCWGFPGLAILFMLFKDGIHRFQRVDKSQEVVLLSSLIMVYLLSSTTQFPLSVARLAYLFPLLYGAFDASTDT